MQDILKSNTPAFVFDTAVLQKRAAPDQRDCRRNSVTLLFHEGKSIFGDNHVDVCG